MRLGRWARAPRWETCRQSSQHRGREARGGTRRGPGRSGQAGTAACPNAEDASGQRGSVRWISWGKALLRNQENFSFFEVRGNSGVLESCFSVCCVDKVWESGVLREAGGDMRSLRIGLMIEIFS